MYRFIFLGLIFFFVTGLVSGLYWWSTKPKKEHFFRFFPPHVLLDEEKRDVTYNSFYFAGGSAEHLYLGNKTAPGYILDMDVRTFSFSPFTLSGLDSSDLSSDLSFHAACHQFYLISDNQGIVFSGPDSGHWVSLLMKRRNVISAFAPLSSYSAVIRRFDPARKSNVLDKRVISASEDIIKTFPLQKQTDGIFDTDGMLQSEDHSGALVYLYYYQNQFVVFDSNLVSKYTGHTLDTNSTVKFSVGFLDNHRRQVIAGTQQANNMRVVFAGSHLMIQSGLIAQNESPTIFKQYAVVDVFDLSDGHYQYSFYIPKPGDQPIRDFTVWSGHLYVLAGHMLFRYQLNLPTKRR